jgi:hypothetical protein
MAVVLAGALVGVAGLVLDGGLLLAARQRALDEAEAAARAGAQAVDVGALRAGRGVVVDPAGAERAVRAFLAGTGHEARVSVDGDVVRVVVRFRQDMVVLGAFGLGPREVSGEGEARALRGVREAEP